MRRTVLALGVSGVLVTATIGLLFVWPTTSGPGRADAVVVLSGDHGERLPRALDAIRRGLTSTLVFAGELDSPQARGLCAQPQAFEVICLLPNPDNTRAEARATGVLAAERRWRTVMVVTSTQHVTRAGLLFRRCVDAKILTLAARPGLGAVTMARLIGHEVLALGHAFTVARGC